MTERRRPPPPPVEPENSGAETRIALALSMVWCLAFAAYVLLFPNLLSLLFANVLNFVVAVVAFGFPLILIWTVAYVSSSIRAIRAESAVLRHTVNQIRHVVSENPQDRAIRDKAFQDRLAEIAALTQQTDNRVSALTERSLDREREELNAPVRDTAALQGDPEALEDPDQVQLPLQSPTKPDRMPITVAEFIRALNFPETAEDKEGFRVLRRAFEERQLGKLLQASQDVLTLLSQDGIYVDDLNPDKPVPGIWRKFADGTRGEEVMALGGIRDRSALTLTKTRIKNDPVFRDAAHHFLRQFDRVLVEFERTAQDNELLEMSNTRTARAFMLLGRVTGAFD